MAREDHTPGNAIDREVGCEWHVLEADAVAHGADQIAKEEGGTEPGEQVRALVLLHELLREAEQVAGRI